MKSSIVGAAAVAVAVSLAVGSAHAQISQSGSISQVVAPGPVTGITGELFVGGIGGGGSVAIDGGASQLTVNENAFSDANVIVGTDNGSGFLDVTNGGRLDIVNTGSAPGFDGATLGISLVFPGAPTLDGDVLVDGGGSQLNIQSQNGDASVLLGRDGLGQLVVSGGAAMQVNAFSANNAGIQIGSSGGAALQPGSQGEMTIDASSVTVTSNGFDAFVNVGRKGSGPTSNVSTLDVLNGGTLEIEGFAGGTSILNLARDGAKSVTTVSGVGSLVSVGDFVNIGRGAGANGTLNVTADGEVDNTGGIARTRLGRDTSSGTLNVTGAGAVYSTGRIDIGQDAGGTDRDGVGRRPP